MKRNLLSGLYSRALTGLPVVGTPAESASSYRLRADSPVEAAELLVGRYTFLCGATGFGCGLPGYLLMPVTVPSNLAAVAILQLHLCAAIAILAGEDPTDEAVRARCIGCLTRPSGDGSPADSSRGIAGRVATKLGERGVRYAGEQVSRIVKRAGARRMPLLGGFLGGYSDMRSTQQVGQNAQHEFLATAES